MKTTQALKIGLNILRIVKFAMSGIVTPDDIHALLGHTADVSQAEAAHHIFDKAVDHMRHSPDIHLWGAGTVLDSFERNGQQNLLVQAYQKLYPGEAKDADILKAIIAARSITRAAENMGFRKSDGSIVTYSELSVIRAIQELEDDPHKRNQLIRFLVENGFEPDDEPPHRGKMPVPKPPPRTNAYPASMAVRQQKVAFG